MRPGSARSITTCSDDADRSIRRKDVFGLPWRSGRRRNPAPVEELANRSVLLEAPHNFTDRKIPIPSPSLGRGMKVIVANIEDDNSRGHSGLTKVARRLSADVPR